MNFPYKSDQNTNGYSQLDENDEEKCVRREEIIVSFPTSASSHFDSTHVDVFLQPIQPIVALALDTPTNGT